MIIKVREDVNDPLSPIILDSGSTHLLKMTPDRDAKQSFLGAICEAFGIHFGTPGGQEASGG